MKPRITLMTLGVDDLERSLSSYRDGLGSETEGIVGSEFDFESVVFIDLESGLKLALFPRKSLARDCGVPVASPSETEFSPGHNVASADEVDAVMTQAERAGAPIVRSAGENFRGGYAGYFQDQDGHLWEIAWNPQLMPPS